MDQRQHGLLTTVKYSRIGSRAQRIRRGALRGRGSAAAAQGIPRREVCGKRRTWLLGTCLAVVLACGGCQTNPITGRSQLLLTSVAEDMQLGSQAYRQMVSDPKVKHAADPRETAPVHRVAARVIAAAKTSKYAAMAQQFQWEVTVIKADTTANAFVLPGGKIAVYTGLFPAAKTEAGLAAVLGHEVVHALARHGAERMSQKMAVNVLGKVAQTALGASGAKPLLSQTAMAAFGLGTHVGILLPFSRTHESEADSIGLLLAAAAGYDPREAIHLWERMEQASGGQAPPEFVSTHPSHGTRIKQLEQWMEEARAIYQATPSVPNDALPHIRW